MINGGAVALLGFVTLQRLAELFWARQQRRSDCWQRAASNTAVTISR